MSEIKINKFTPNICYFHDIVKNIPLYNDYKTLHKKKISYGVILYKKENDHISYLICQKRHTHHYISYICGRYNINKLYDILSLMTEEERMNILKYDFDKLWNDVNNCSYSKGYIKAKKKFNSILPYINELYSCCPSQNLQEEWEFPKGRRNKDEFSLDCAKREFKEEIEVSIDDLTPSYPFTINEKLIGTNNVVYHYRYYLFEWKNEKFHANPKIKKLSGKTINNEIKMFRWIQIPMTDYDDEFQKLYQIFNKKRTNIVYNIHIALQQEPLAISMKDIFIPKEEKYSMFIYKEDDVCGNIIIV